MDQVADGGLPGLRLVRGQARDLAPAVARSAFSSLEHRLLWGVANLDARIRAARSLAGPRRDFGDIDTWLDLAKECETVVEALAAKRERALAELAETLGVAVVDPVAERVRAVRRRLAELAAY